MNVLHFAYIAIYCSHPHHVCKTVQSVYVTEMQVASKRLEFFANFFTELANDTTQYVIQKQSRRQVIHCLYPVINLLE